MNVISMMTRLQAG